ncbi:hypothetical protein FRC20_010933 [Serendipita sp. 405]|nr:hypothetical protein FRC15_000503 [Serendipita sp. 397]KAG8871112.1 hypothetical protein FRC20_010933 [Serendipita sp. 405]
MATQRPLSDSWFWKRYRPEVDDLQNLTLIPNVATHKPTIDEWSPCCAFPTETYVELKHAGHIPDPILGFNEHKVQWVAECDWLFACNFSLDEYEGLVQGKVRSEIFFEGLDTICDVYLNGKRVLSTDNMFDSYTLPITTPDSVSKSSNTLVLHFRSAKHYSKELEQRYGAVRAGSCNLGDPSRVYIRKAQYHYRWDWGPELISSGPWKPVLLRTFSTRIKEFESHAKVLDIESEKVALSILVDIEGKAAHSLDAILLDERGNIVRKETVTIASGEKGTVKLDWEFVSGEVKLWWPMSYGKTHLYMLRVTLLDKAANEIDKADRKIGFRRVELLQYPLLNAPGTTFCFRINGIKMFLGGSNWIPADCFLTTVTEGKYRSWLQLMKDGGQNCVRVWGGGIYESDAFYDICDELGILVWQDMAFACGVYPAHPSFVESVEGEVISNLKRLRHHPSLAILCGNNEDYLQIKMWGVEGGLPAAVLYEKVFPKLVEELVQPPIPYVFGSPYGGKGDDTSDPTVGDVHQWDIWAGAGAPYQDYDILGGRFISEFGVPSLPCLATMESYFADCDDTDQRHPQSQAIQQHTKAGSYERRFSTLMNENFRMTGDLESYMYLTQLMQSEALGYAYRVWRRKWGGEGREETSGILVWQLNDCWPVTSWAVCDYHLRCKPAYYAIAREMKTVTVGIQREVQKNRVNDRPRPFYEYGAFQSVSATIDVWASNLALSSEEVELELFAFDLKSDWTYKETRRLVLPPNASIDVLTGHPCPHGPISPGGMQVPHPSCSVAIGAFIRDREGRLLSQHIDWPQPYKFLRPCDPQVTVVLDGERLVVRVLAPVKGLVLSVPGGEDDVIWSDNCLDVVPDHPYEVTVKGLRGRAIYAAYLGRERALPLALSS